MTGIFANVRTVENLMALFIPYRVTHFVFLFETLYLSLIIQVIVTTLIVTLILVTDNRFIHLIVLPSFFYVVY